MIDILAQRAAVVRARTTDTTRSTISLFIVYVFGILPLATLLLYPNEFASDPSVRTVAGILTLAVLTTIPIVVLLFCLIPRSLHGVLCRGLCVLLGLAWYNFNCLDYRGKIVGADPDVFSNSYSWLEIVGLSVFSAFVMLSGRASKLIVPVMSLACIVGAINLFFVDVPKRSLPGYYPNISKELYSFSKEANVLHIVLDGMEGSLFSDLLAAKGETKEVFEGFRFYPDTLASADVTYFSFHSFLSGQAFDGRTAMRDYFSRIGISISDSGDGPLGGIFRPLRDNNFDIDILSACPQCTGFRSGYRSYAYKEFLPEPSFGHDLLKLVDFTLLRALPWSGKSFIYRDGEPYFSSIGTVGRANRAAQFIREFGSKIVSTSPTKTYKLLHFLSPHGPYTTGPDCEPAKAEISILAIRNQASCVLKSVAVLLSDLKRAGLYDSTMILIHGDHGICLGDGLPTTGDMIPTCVGNSHPLLLIKPQRSRGPLRVDDTPTELLDIASTILSENSIEHSLPGIPIGRQQEIPDRVRHYYMFTPDRSTAYARGRVDTTEIYSVKGSMFKRDAWSKSMLSSLLDADGISPGEIVDVEKVERVGGSMRVYYQGSPPRKGMYVTDGQHKIPIGFNKHYIAFRLKGIEDSASFTLVDPVGKLKEALPKPQ
jgi:hypothetical protein